MQFPEAVENIIDSFKKLIDNFQQFSKIFKNFQQ
jgi:hypothetical protein